MKIQTPFALTLLILVGLIVFYLLWFQPAPTAIALKTEPPQSAAVVSSQADAAAIVDEQNAGSDRRERMQSAFAGLTQARQVLKSKANLLKSLSWGIELPSDQARQISHEMREAYVYLKNPPMLGAYSEVEDIMRESRKVESMMANLEKAELTMQALREAQKSGQ